MNNAIDYNTELKNALLDILDEFVEICNNHNLRYFLAYGSCLGAIRHNGFIPWDDDIDIGMPRHDYDLFINKYYKELPERMYVQSINTYKNNWLKFSKIRLRDTLFISGFMKNANIDKEQLGISIDVFPYESINGIGKIIIFREKVINKIEVLLWIKCGIIQTDSKLIRLLKLCPYRILHHIQNILMKGFSRNKEKLLASYCSPYGICKDHFYYEDILPTRKHVFENKEYYIPNRYKVYLNRLYGNYMDLPPIDKRVAHKPFNISFK